MQEELEENARKVMEENNYKAAKYILENFLLGNIQVMPGRRQRRDTVIFKAYEIIRDARNIKIVKEKKANIRRIKMKNKCDNCIIGSQDYYFESYCLKETDIPNIDWTRLSKYNYCPICGRKINWQEIENKYKEEL